MTKLIFLIVVLSFNMACYSNINNIEEQKSSSSFRNIEYSFIDNDTLSQLINNPNIDSVYNSLRNGRNIDATLRYIDTVLYETAHLAAPDRIFNITSPKRISILLLDSTQTIIRVILNQTMNPGLYWVYLRSNLIQEDYLSGNAEFLFLDIVGNEYEYMKGFFIK